MTSQCLREHAEIIVGTHLSGIVSETSEMLQRTRRRVLMLWMICEATEGESRPLLTRRGGRFGVLNESKKPEPGASVEAAMARDTPPLWAHCSCTPVRLAHAEHRSNAAAAASKT